MPPSGVRVREPLAQRAAARHVPLPVGIGRQVGAVDGNGLAHLRVRAVQGGEHPVNARGQHFAVLAELGREPVAGQCEGAPPMASRSAACSAISRAVRVQVGSA